MRFCRAAALAASVVLGLLAGCGAESAAPPTPVVNSVPIEEAVHVPQPLPAEPVLKPLGSNEFVWGNPDHDDSRLVRVLFDNGTDGDVQITLAEGAAIPVASRERVTLFTHVGPVRFLALEADKPDAETISLPAESGDLVVFNPGSAWDYEYEEVGYSTIPTLDSAGPGKIHLIGPRCFRTRDVAFLFEPTPSSVSVTTYRGFGSASKRALRHLQEAPTPGREVRRQSVGESDDRHIVFDGSAVHVHRLGATADEHRRTLHIDHAAPDGSGLLALHLDGEQLVELPADDLLRATLPAGRFEWTAFRNGETVDSQTIEAEHDGRYVWSPGGMRTWMMDFKVYSISAFGFGNDSKERSAAVCRGLRFFRCEAPLVFEDFPESFKMPIHRWQMTVARLSRGDVGSTQDELTTEWNTLQERVRSELSPDDLRQFLRETPPVNSEHLSDCDLWLAEAWLAHAQSDDERTVDRINDLLEFRPEATVAYRLRGLAAARLDRISAALDDLRTATRRDTTLATELDPKIAELERLRDERASQAEAERQ